jgi:hypothetical protein
MQPSRHLPLVLALQCFCITLVSAQTDILVPGFLKFEVYTDIPGVAVADLTSAAKFPAAPDHVWYATAFDSRTVYRDDSHTNRGVRISGFITPSVSGDYQFMLRSDDASQLFLSPDNSVAGLALIAEETTCCGAFEEPGASETSAVKTLVAGQSYAIRALYKQGGGGNYCQVAWRIVGDPTPAASLSPISGTFLSTMIPAAGTISITQQPAAVTAAAAASATFKVQFTTSLLPVMVIWQKNGINLPGRLGDTLTLGPLTAADAGAYRAVVSIPGATVTSAAANLTVTPDVTPPRVAQATVGDTLATVSIEFSEAMDPGGLADTFSYVLSDSIGTLLSVFNAVPVGPSKVRLTTETLTVGATYNLSLVDIRDLAGNPPADGNTFLFPTLNRTSGGLRFEAYLNLPGTDPGVVRSDPRYPDSPDIAAFVTEFSSRQVFADAQSRDNYGGRLYGWIVPQETAQYQFFIRSDDGSQLYLSPDQYSAHAVVIAGETGCCGPFEEPGAPETSAPMSLTANQAYYIEAIWKEGGGGDYCDVAWRKVGDTAPARTLPYIPGSVLAADAPPATFVAPTVAFTSPPGGSIIGAAVPLTLTLSATAASPKSVSKIEILEQGRVVGQINESPFFITFYELREDSHTFIARVTDSAGQTATSAPLTISVGGEIQRISLLAINDLTTWRYDRSGQDLGTAWREPAFNDGSWPAGPTLIADESTTTVEPIRTAISRFNDQGQYVKTFYFRTRFNFTGAAIPGIKLALRHVVDDGAVFYLNGTEIHRFGIAAGPVDATTDATGHENVYEGPYDIPVTALREGENVLAAEVHQAGGSSSDMVFGAELTATVPVIRTNLAVVAIDTVTRWRYDRSGQDLGTAWREPAFSDSSWPSGLTLIADESTTTVEPIRTAISRFNDQGQYVKTFYFRTHFDFPAQTTDRSKIRLRHVIDDGAVLYLNGFEIHRFGIAAGPVDATTDATGHENVYEGPFDIPVDHLLVGDNVLAAEVHQAGGSSSDMVFGAEVIISVPVSNLGPQRPRLTATRNASGQVIISWSPAGGVLESSTSLGGGAWLPVPNATNPQTVTPGASPQFYRVKQ